MVKVAVIFAPISMLLTQLVRLSSIYVTMNLSVQLYPEECGYNLQLLV